MSTAAVVYFVQMGADGPIKIGTSRTFVSRLAALRQGCPQPLTVLGTVLGDSSVEGQWHRRFRHLRQQGEWFTPAPALLKAITKAMRLQADTPSPAEVPCPPVQPAPWIVDRLARAALWYERNPQAAPPDNRLALYERDVDPTGQLAPQERRYRAEQARRADMLRLAHRSAEVRRKAAQ